MYIWVLLATFITLLFSFNLSVRSDMKELYVDTQAATVASKMYVQHKAAEEYFKAKVKEYKAGSEGPHFGDASERNVDFDDRLPYYATVPSFQGATGAHSILYCVKRDQLTEPLLCSAGDDLSCCIGKGLKYLVTVVPIPIRWQARDAEGRAIKSPNTSMINALKNVSSHKLQLGYLIEDNGYYIEGVSEDPMQIHTAVGNDLKKYCGVNAVHGEGLAFCMIFASSI